MGKSRKSAASTSATVSNVFTAKRVSKSSVSKAKHKDAFIEYFIPVAQKGHATGEVSTNMYMKVLPNYKDTQAFKEIVKEKILWKGQNIKSKFDDKNDPHFLIPALVPQSAVDLSEHMNSLPNTTVKNITIEDALDNFNPKTIEKAKVDLIPDGDSWALHGSLMYPMLDDMRNKFTSALNFNGNFKGSGMCVNMIDADDNVDIEEVIEYFQKWGIKVNKYTDFIFED